MKSINNNAVITRIHSDRLFFRHKILRSIAPFLLFLLIPVFFQGCGKKGEEDPGGQPICGNNVREADQVCDGQDLDGQTCISLGFDGGNLACRLDCMEFETSGCFFEGAECGNDIREGNEVCDGEDLAGETCISHGFDAGELACRDDCSGFDTSDCFFEGAECGNNIREGNEVCDGEDLAGETCISHGFDAGELACRNDCSGFDTSDCFFEGAVCGNDIREGNEVCDGEDLAGESCESLGFFSGQLICKQDCSGFITTSCDGCGNGRIDPGETSENCCVDVGCPEGVCDADEMRCVDPWILACPEGSDSCSDLKPWYCREGSLPLYDCERCGCPDGKTCMHGFCYEPEVLDAERTSVLDQMHLPLEKYFELYDRLIHSPALTFEEFSEKIDRLFREDRRRTALLLGESHGSFEEQAAGVSLMRFIQDRGWNISSVGIESNTLDYDLIDDMNLDTFEIIGGLGNEAYCSAAQDHTENRLNNSEGIYVQYTGSGHTSREIAYHEGYWAISRVPHAAECVYRGSRKAITVIMFDPAIWLIGTDRSMMWRLGNFFPDADQVSSELDSSIEIWEQTMGADIPDSDYDAYIGGDFVNIRMIEGVVDDVFYGYFSGSSRPPYFLKGYRVLWNELPIQEYLLTHDIHPGNCSVSWNLTPGEEGLWFSCGKGGYSLSAQVNPLDFSLVEWDTSP